MINLMNYYEHPADNRYYIFEFRDVEKAISFENLLDEYSVTFEKMVEGETDEDWMTYYAVSKTYFKEALRANNLTESKYRSPMIGNVYARYFFVILMMGIVALAFVGYCKTNF